jgi:hypothetical protein
MLPDNDFSEEQKERFSSPRWSRHVKEMLLNLLVQKRYSKEDLQRAVETNSGVFELNMLGGATYSVNSDTVIGEGSSKDAVGAVDG